MIHLTVNYLRRSRKVTAVLLTVYPYRRIGAVAQPIDQLVRELPYPPVLCVRGPFPTGRYHNAFGRLRKRMAARLHRAQHAPDLLPSAVFVAQADLCTYLRHYS